MHLHLYYIAESHAADRPLLGEYIEQIRTRIPTESLNSDTNVFFCRILLGLNPNWETCSFHLLGQNWDYMVAMEHKAYEGFFESGLQLILQTYIQQRTNWPSFEPLLGAREKGIFFQSTKPGNKKNS